MGETEKITINMSVVDLGKVDLLVQEGFYQNRTDFIRTSIRSQLSTHETEVRDSITRNAYVLGIMGCNQESLMNDIAKGVRRKYYVVGMMVIEEDVTPEVADKAIEAIKVMGVFRAPDDVKAVLSDRIL
jgi:Arc/MetJ-type ribon-helix-helix transcriptional regulator